MATQKALSGEAGDAVRSLAETLSPGTAIAVVLLEHPWADALADAVARVGGTELARDFVDTSRISELTSRLLGAAEDAAEHARRPLERPTCEANGDHTEACRRVPGWLRAG